MESLGFEAIHGLTETYGHVVHCAWNKDWDNLADEKRSELKAYQGVRYPHRNGIGHEPETLNLSLPMEKHGGDYDPRKYCHDGVLQK